MNSLRRIRYKPRQFAHCRKDFRHLSGKIIFQVRDVTRVGDGACRSFVGASVRCMSDTPGAGAVHRLRAFLRVYIVQQGREFVSVILMIVGEASDDLARLVVAGHQIFMARGRFSGTRG